MSQRWELRSAAPAAFFETFSGLPPLIAQLLYNRGLRDGAAIREFLTGDALCDPSLMPNVALAARRLDKAIEDGETVAVYGDYDLDGISATALLVQGLSGLGARVIPHIPHRLSGGYGLKIPSLKRLRERGASLVVSVDCGITAVKEVAAAARFELDIIITDHHTPLAKLPAAVALLNPKLPGSKYPFRDLTGVGVAFTLLRVLYAARGREAELESYYDLVALGTVADIAPLLGENRALVRRGLRLMNSSPRAGIRGLVAGTGLRVGQINSDSIAWVLAPRLNAAGRLVHAMSSYRILVTTDVAQAAALADKLERKNRERQQLTASAQAQAREMALEEGPAELIFCGDTDFAAGIVGLVAGRLCEEFYRPAVVLSRGWETSSGSSRSIPEFNIVAALDSCGDLLSDYGGHAAAAGFTVRNRHVPELKTRLMTQAQAALAGVDLRPTLTVDYELPLPELDGDVFRAVGKLAPYGAANPQPTFLSRDAPVTDCVSMGAAGAHLKFKFDGGARCWEAVAFRQGGRYAGMSRKLDIVYNLETDYWHGEARQRLNVIDFEPAAPY